MLALRRSGPAFGLDARETANVANPPGRYRDSEQPVPPAGRRGINLNGLKTSRRTGPRIAQPRNLTRTNGVRRGGCGADGHGRRPRQRFSNRRGRKGGAHAQAYRLSIRGTRPGCRLPGMPWVRRSVFARLFTATTPRQARVAPGSARRRRSALRAGRGRSEAAGRGRPESRCRAVR
jgi:hypothetical protein